MSKRSEAIDNMLFTLSKALFEDKIIEHFISWEWEQRSWFIRLFTKPYTERRARIELMRASLQRP